MGIVFEGMAISVSRAPIDFADGNYDITYQQNNGYYWLS